jgi:hypothetical protein
MKADKHVKTRCFFSSGEAIRPSAFRRKTEGVLRGDPLRLHKKTKKNFLRNPKRLK